MSFGHSDCGEHETWASAISPPVPPMPPAPTPPLPVVPPEPPVAVTPPEPVLALFCKLTVPVLVGFVPCGVMFSLVPATQNEYLASLSSVTSVPEVVYSPLVEASKLTIPIQPVCLTVAEHVQPPLAAAVQLTES